MTPSKQLGLLRRSGVVGALVATGFAGTLAAQTGNPALGVDVRNLDTSVRPQDDFFRYVNGGWLRRTQIPADRSSFGSFVELRDRSEESVRLIVEEAAAARNQPGSDAQKVGDLYRSYMDTVAVERAGLTPLRPELARIAALRDRSELPELYGRLQRIGVGTPFSFIVGQDARQATRYIGSVGQGGLGLPDRDYYLKDDAKLAQARTAYQTYVETLLRLSGDANPAAGAQAVVAFERALAEKHWDRARSRDREATYNLRTVAQLDSMTQGFAWGRFLRAVNAERTPGVVVRQPDYLTAMNQVVAATPIPVLKQYLTVKLLDSYASSLPRAFGAAQFAFRGRALQGLEAERPRWKRGVGAVEGALGEATGRLYVQRSFRPESRTRMQQLVENLRASFSEGINGLEWMSPETKTQAQAKLAKFAVKIGYPDQWRDYSALEIRPGDLAGNITRVAMFGHNRMVSRLGQPIDRGEWGMTPQTVNAYYSPTMNEIVFPAAILQPPFFNPAADDAVNYGGIGAVIGHEMSHGFDDQGRRSDGEGNLRDWWTEADNAAFKTRADALVAQYNAFSPVAGLNVNGRLTLGENIGDLSGIAMAYRAYKKSLNGREAPVIDGFTGDQRFFMGFAQIWRSLQREDALRQQVMTDPHSPGEYRTNGVLRNIPEFYAAFNVQPGDKMYLPPEQRVKIW